MPRVPGMTLLTRAARVGRRVVSRALARSRDRRGATYAHNLAGGPLHRYLGRPPLPLLRANEECFLALARLYTEHRFDLLGSGWVRVAHGLACAGLEGHRYPPGPAVQADSGSAWLRGRLNPANLPEAQRIWGLIDPGYVPIDWQLDFKSGFRWSEQTWSGDLRFGQQPGADIKVPWELSRMQHLPMLAWARFLTRGDPAGPGPVAAQPAALEAARLDCPYAREFRNQVLDFIAANPPRFGVNWVCPMDVAIRVANWLVGWDLFHAAGARFDAAFEAVLTRSVWEHGRHLTRHLEWNDRFRGNHYLANLVGLLFAAAYLPCGPETECWLAFAAQELAAEVPLQFHPEGSNAEASTCYHRLSAEMVLYGTALLLSLPEEKRRALRAYDARAWEGVRPLAPGPSPLVGPGGFADAVCLPEAYCRRLAGMARFVRDITRPDGLVPQFGDNDSGRFLKLHPVCRRLRVAEAKARFANLQGWTGLPDDDEYWLEEHLDHHHLLAGLAALFGQAAPPTDGQGASLEHWAVAHLVGGRSLVEPAPAGTLFSPQHPAWEPGPEVGPPSGGDAREDSNRTPALDFLDGLALAAYPEFGLYIFRSKSLYLAVRCGGVGQGGVGGHAHNDQMSFELAVNGVPVVVDPGTYLYTPLLERRNQMRATAAHATCAPPGREQNPLPEGLRGCFRLPDCAQARVVACDARSITMSHTGFGGECRRILRIEREAVHGLDERQAEEPITAVFPLRGGCRPDGAGGGGARLLAGPALRLELTAEGGTYALESSLSSPGYGLAEVGVTLQFLELGGRLTWSLRCEPRQGG